MVAITVILAAVIGTFVLDLSNSAGNNAPSASLSVDVDTTNDNMTIEHTGGDGLDSSETRIVLTDESAGTSNTYEPTGSSFVLSVGSTAEINVTAAGTDRIDWNGNGNFVEENYAVTTNNIDNFASGQQYSLQLIDTENQRVIYETTITA